MQDILESLKIIVGETRVLINEPMSKHTTFKIGGPAEYYIIVNNVKELKDVLQLSRKNKVKTTVIGNGSNILVKDKGIQGFVIKINLKNINFEEENIINVESGVLLSKLAIEAQKRELTGIEFASGIPGTIGGAIRMNAGAYGEEIKELIAEVTYIDDKLELKTIKNEEVHFEYRNSRFTNNKNEVIISAKFLLHKGKKVEIEKLMEEYKKSRKEKQPINLPSAGSIFKRGSNFITAKLIDECGLKGYKIGDAEISTKHAGFIVNNGKATAKDVLKLTKYVQTSIQKKYNENIELEIEVLGED